MRRLLTAGVVGFLFCYTGCCQVPLDSANNIVVSRPAVFTRERLLNRRLQEVAFLETKLGEKYVPSFQGLQDVREFSGLVGQVKASFDPLGGAASSLGIANIQRQEQTSELQHQTDLLLLQQQLNATREKPTTQPITQLGSDTPSTTATALSAPTLTGSPLDAFTATRPTLPSAADLVTTAAKPTAIESLRDEMAYRDTIQAFLREKELDDTHDLHGFTLYTLKFDITTLPGVRTDRYGKVSITLQDSPAPPAWPEDKTAGWRQLRQTYNDWRQRFRQDVQTEALSLQRAEEMGFLSESEQLELLDRMHDTLNHLTQLSGAYIDNSPTQEMLKAKIKVFQGAAGVFGLSAKADPQQRQAIRQALCLVVEDRYRSFTAADTEIVEFGALQEGVNSLDGFYTPTVDEPNVATIKSRKTASPNLTNNLYQRKAGNDRAAAEPSPSAIAFYNFVERLRSINNDDESGKAYVYSVEPKEYAQNISEVAAAEKLRSFAIALSAVLPSAGVGAAGSLNSLNDSQNRLQSILRNPLVVGYLNNQQNFGWLLGPHFKIGPDSTIQYEHGPVQQSVQATIAIAAWQRSVSLNGTTQWLQNNATTRPLWGDSPASSVTLQLPSDPSALTKALLSANATEDRTPHIDPRYDPEKALQKILVRGAKDAGPQSILIRGTDLWRNPSVFIGGQKASALEVLPDMHGILATFQTINTPPSLDGKEVLADLTVVTSGGTATLQNGVRIVIGTTPPAPTASLRPNFIIGPGNVEFQLDPNTFPKALISMTLRLKLDGQQVSFVDTKAPFTLSDKRDKVTFALPADATQTGLYAVDLRIKMNLSDDDVSLPIVGRKTFAWYTQKSTGPTATLEAGSKTLTFDNTTGASTPAGATIVFSTGTDAPTAENNQLFDAAYPGLRDALKAGRAKLLLKPDDTSAVPSTAVSLKEHLAAGAVLTGAIVSADDFTAAKLVPTKAGGTNVYKSLQLQYSDTVPAVAVVGGPLTLSRSN